MCVNQSSKKKIPDFLFEGKLDHTNCHLNLPLTGELLIKKCAVDIKSIELQLVRVESCTYMEGEAREGIHTHKLTHQLLNYESIFAMLRSINVHVILLFLTHIFI